MLELLYYKRNPLITAVADGSIFKENIKAIILEKRTLEEVIIFAWVLQ